MEKYCRPHFKNFKANRKFLFVFCFTHGKNLGTGIGKIFWKAKTDHDVFIMQNKP